MVGIFAVKDLEMQVALKVLRKGIPEMVYHFSRELSGELSFETRVEVEEKPPGKVNDTAGETIIHGDVGMAVPPDKFFIPECLAKGLPERNPHVFDRMVFVDMQVSLASGFQVETAMPGKKIEHVIEEANSRMVFVMPVSIQVDSNNDFCFARIPGNVCFPLLKARYLRIHFSVVTVRG